MKIITLSKIKEKFKDVKIRDFTSVTADLCIANNYIVVMRDNRSVGVLYATKNKNFEHLGERMLIGRIFSLSFDYKSTGLHEWYYDGKRTNDGRQWSDDIVGYIELSFLKVYNSLD